VYADVNLLDIGQLLTEELHDLYLSSKYSGDEIKKNNLGGARGMYEG
jgi:hypothetical protein